MRAVVFDLFGTLTDPAVEVTRRHVVARTAAALGVNADRFLAELRTTRATASPDVPAPPHQIDAPQLLDLVESASA